MGDVLGVVKAQISSWKDERLRNIAEEQEESKDGEMQIDSYSKQTVKRGEPKNQFI